MLFYRAIAASAPILQFTGHTDCEAFSRIVTSDFRVAHPTCPKVIRKSWAAITNITSSRKLIFQLKIIFISLIIIRFISILFLQIFLNFKCYLIFL